MPSLVQIMVCRWTLSEPVIVYCQLDPKEHISMKFDLKFKSFHSRKCIWKCCLQKWQPSCLGLNVPFPFLSCCMQHCIIFDHPISKVCSMLYRNVTFHILAKHINDNRTQLITMLWMINCLKVSRNLLGLDCMCSLRNSPWWIDGQSVHQWAYLWWSDIYFWWTEEICNIQKVVSKSWFHQVMLHEMQQKPSS